MNPETEFTLKQFESVASTLATSYSLANGDPVNVQLANKDDGFLYGADGAIDFTAPLATRTSELEQGIIMAAGLEDRDRTPTGTGTTRRVEATVSVTIEGLTARHGQYGHIDPDGGVGAPFEEAVRLAVDQLQASQSFPSVGKTDVTYHDLTTTNESDQSNQFQHLYRYEFDALYRGYEC